MTSSSFVPVMLLIPLVHTFAFVIVHAVAAGRTTTNHPHPSFVHSPTGPRALRIPRLTETWKRGGTCSRIGTSGLGGRRYPTPVSSSTGGNGACGSDGSSSSSSSSLTSVVDRLDLRRPFERWVLLRNLLEGGVHADDVNEVLYLTLSSVPKMYKAGKMAGRGQAATAEEEEWKEHHEESPPPALDGDDLRTVRHILDRAVVAHNGAKRIPALIGPDCASSAGDDPSVLSDLETLLPDPDEDEDAHKGAWDTVMELHGRESVRMEEEGSGDGREDWDARCLVARVLIYFNFLADGIVGHDGDL